MRIAAFALLFVSCTPPGLTCSSDAVCGELEACVSEHCTAVECLSSVDCAMEHACTLETHTCDAGCVTSDDCYTADRCDITIGVCVPRSCTDTQLDCRFGERCNTATGACEKDPDPHCEPCYRPNDCGVDGACVSTDGTGPFCFLECSPESYDPCPAGMQCTYTSEGLHRCVGFCEGL